MAQIPVIAIKRNLSLARTITNVFWFIAAFHEAIGEAIGLSAGTPKHLQALGLVPVSVEDSAVDINYLYQMALDKIAFLPFAFVMDKWRYDVFNGKVGKEEYNCHWHILRQVLRKLWRVFSLDFECRAHA